MPDETIVHRGQKRTDVNSGDVSLEQGRDRLRITEEGVPIHDFDKKGIRMYGEDGVKTQALFGRHPDGSLNFTIVIPGEDIEALF